MATEPEWPSLYLEAAQRADRYMKMAATLRAQLIETQAMLIEANDKLIAANHARIMDAYDRLQDPHNPEAAETQPRPPTPEPARD